MIEINKSFRTQLALWIILGSWHLISTCFHHPPTIHPSSPTAFSVALTAGQIQSNALTQSTSPSYSTAEPFWGRVLWPPKPSGGNQHDRSLGLLSYMNLHYVYIYIIIYYYIISLFYHISNIYICIYLFNYISIYTHEYQRILHQYLWNVDSHPYLGLSMSDPVLHGARFQHQLMDVLLCQTDLLEDLFEIPLFQHTHSRKEAAQGGPVGWRHGATGNGFGMGTGSRWWFFGGKKELYSIYSIHVMGCQPLLWCYMEEELHLVLTLYLLWLWDVYMF